MAIKIAGSDLKGRVGRVSGNTGIFLRPEAGFSLYPPLTVVVPLFHYICRAPFSVTRQFKNFVQNFQQK